MVLLYVEKSIDKCSYHYVIIQQLLTTADEVAKLQEELATMRPLLEEAVKESVQTMEKISKDTIVANETKAIVQKEEAAATIKATETQAIADDAQRDLNEALPALVRSQLVTLSKIQIFMHLYQASLENTAVKENVLIMSNFSFFCNVSNSIQ